MDHVDVEEELWLRPRFGKDDRMELQVTYSSRKSQRVLEEDLSSSSSLQRLSISIGDPVVGTRIHATFNDTTSTMDVQRHYANLIRSLSSSQQQQQQQQQSILSCAPYDALLWKFPSHSTLTDIVVHNNNTTTGTMTTVTSYLPEQQISHCHIQTLLVPFIDTSTTTTSTADIHSVSMWMEYVSERQEYSQGIQYRITYDTNKSPLWKDIFVYPHHRQKKRQQQSKDCKIFVELPNSAAMDRMILHHHPHHSSQQQQQVLPPSKKDDTTTLYQLRCCLSEDILSSNVIFQIPPSTTTTTTTTQDTTPTKEDSIPSIQRRIVRNQGVTNSGTFYTQIHFPNNHVSSSSSMDNFTTLDFFPTILTPIWHSLRIQYSTPNTTTTTTTLLLDPIHDTLRRRIRTTQDGLYHALELSFPPPSSSSMTMRISIDYDYALLSYDEYPPADPNKGIHLPPSQIIISNNNNNNDDSNHYDYYYSNSVLVMPPVSDMSMPFNVISITSTLQIFVFAILLNFAVQKASQKITKFLIQPPKKSKFQRIQQKLATLLSKSSRQTETNNDDDDDDE